MTEKDNEWGAQESQNPWARPADPDTHTGSDTWLSEEAEAPIGSSATEAMPPKPNEPAPAAPVTGQPAPDWFTPQTPAAPSPQVPVADSFRAGTPIPSAPQPPQAAGQFSPQAQAPATPQPSTPPVPQPSTLPTTQTPTPAAPLMPSSAVPSAPQPPAVGIPPQVSAAATPYPPQSTPASTAAAHAAPGPLAPQVPAPGAPQGPSAGVPEAPIPSGSQPSTLSTAQGQAALASQAASVGGPASGWYPDPADSTRQRFWNGASWTAETRPDPAQAPTPLPPATAGAPAGTITPGYGQAPAQPVYGGYGRPVASAPVAPSYSGPVTADGVPLAGWGIRLVSTIIDYLFINAVIGATLFMTVFRRVFDGFEHWMNDFLDAYNTGNTAGLPMPTDPAYGIGAQLTQYYVVLTLVALVYTCAMLIWKGATLGQLACGLRVVPQDRGRDWNSGISPVSALIRGISFSFISGTGTNVLAMLPIGAITMISMVATVANGLWPLWDPKRQAWHDKLAKTQVVRPAAR